MRRVAAATLAALLALLLGGCSAAADGAPDRPDGQGAASGQHVSDVGNERPEVGYDGLMVRRRVAVAFHLERGTDPAAVGRQARRAGRLRGWPLLDVPPGVLDAALLEHLVPEVVLLFPENATTIDADRVLRSRRIPGVDHTHTVPVLVHDLRLAVRTGHSRAARRALDREGVLTDLLGHYDTVAGTGSLDVLYTGPLLGDALVEDAADALGRAAGAPATIHPRSDRGAGVDMSREPRPDPVPDVPPGPDSGHEGPGH